MGQVIGNIPYRVKDWWLLLDNFVIYIIINDNNKFVKNKIQIDFFLKIYLYFILYIFLLDLINFKYIDFLLQRVKVVMVL